MESAVRGYWLDECVPMRPYRDKFSVDPNDPKGPARGAIERGVVVDELAPTFDDSWDGVDGSYCCDCCTPLAGAITPWARAS